MKASNSLWKERLGDRLSGPLADDIDVYETDLERRQQGDVDEKLFAETRLRRGAYGQRYDNGKRHDGVATRELPYDPTRKSKGPGTHWDAPGMQRIKIPYGGITPEQLEVLAEVAEEYSDDIAHITTRQDFQLHYIHLDDTPTLMRRLAAVGITTREACGNTIRNVTGCPFAGVCADEVFDVSPYAHALTYFLLGHPDCQDFGRKFKIAFSGCAQHACGLTAMHDVGLTAVTRQVDGQEQRGFRMVVGGGLGAVPHQAKLFEEFLPLEELLPTVQAIARVFARLGEKKNRNRARLKFLVNDRGIDAFRELVRQEREILPFDARWHDLVENPRLPAEEPLRPPGERPAVAADASPRERAWYRTNLRPQKQEGYVAATVVLPLGDITSMQLRALADIARRFTRGTLRTTVEQNFVLRWVSESDLPDLYRALDEVGLADPGASHIFDIVACPGTDTCKLGIASSRGLAAELRQRLIAKGYELEEAVNDLHIKVSGCFNSCGQHHVADLGFYGVSRRAHGYKVPHFQVVIGGQWEENAASYGLPIGTVPSKRVPEAVDQLTERYVRERRNGEKFRQFAARIGKSEIKKMLDSLSELPSHEEDSSYYVDWGDAREYSTGDIGVGECAGEVVSVTDFELSTAERLVFEGQLLLEEGKAAAAGHNAHEAMVQAAKALVKVEFLDVPDDADRVVAEFRSRYYDTRKFFDPFAGGKFAQYLFAAHEKRDADLSPEAAHHRIEEAQLFIEAAHACYDRLGSAAAT